MVVTGYGTYKGRDYYLVKNRYDISAGVYNVVIGASYIVTVVLRTCTFLHSAGGLTGVWMAIF